MLPSALLVLLAMGCGQPVSCSSPEQVLTTAGERQLRCEDAQIVGRYVQLLAGRPSSPRDRTRILTEVRDRWSGDPNAGDAWIAEIRTAILGFEGKQGLDGAEKRSSEVWKVSHGDGLITSEDTQLWSVLSVRMKVWASDDDEKLALTESDIEGWILYASLCREVQGGGAMRLSVSDRQALYNTVRDRWNNGTRADLTALVALGPYWSQARRSWKSASYEKQQAWISEAPLPPPMTATSLGYADAIFQGDLSRHVSVIHDKLGPFYVRVD